MTFRLRCLLIFVLALITGYPRLSYAQNVENQPIASQYGSFKVPATQMGSYTFAPGACQQSAGNRNFAAFSTGTPVKIVDANPAQTEIVTPSSVYINDSQCVINVAPVYTHVPPFYLTSGTGGLQEALVNSMNISGANTIILDTLWHQSVGANAASIIAAAKGNTTISLVDITTSPYSFYSYVGGTYVAVSYGSATIPSTTSLLKGTGTFGISVPATPGTDYVIPSGNVATATTATTAGTAANLSGTPSLPNGTTATTQSCASNGLLATGAYVANCGAGTSLPTATGAGQAPVSTGAGTTYTAQGVLYTGGNYNSTQNSQTPTYFPSVGTILQADGFPSGGGTYRGAWSSAITYNRFDTVTSGGVDWIAVNGSINVTPAQAADGAAQFWAQFDASGAGLAATQADTAFYWAWEQVQVHATGFSVYSSVGLHFGSPVGGYLKNGDWTMPTNAYGYTISIFGDGRGQTWIHQNASTLAYMVNSPNVSSSGGQTISGITLDANLLAGGCLSHHLRRSLITDVACWNPQQQSGGTVGSAMWLGSGADAYESLYSHLLVRGPTYTGLVAAYGTATVTSGAITGITWGSTGTNLNLPVTAGPGLVAYFIGKGATSSSWKPCGTMPVVSAIALTGGSINTGTGVGGFTFSSAGATCGGTIYVRVQQAGTLNQAYYLNGSDTTVNDIVTSGDFKQECEFVNGPNLLSHEHPYCAAPYQILATGGYQDHISPELDSPIQYGIYMGGTGGTVIQGAMTEYNAGNEYGAGDFLVDAASGTITIQGSGCFLASQQTFGGYAKFTGTGVGPMTTTNFAPSTTSFITGAEPNCDGSGTLWGNFPASSGSSGSQKVVYVSKLASIPATTAVIPGSSASGTTDASSIINAAISGGNVDLEVDGGYALSTNLVVYSNTTIHCVAPQFGFIMQAAANTPVINNAHQNAPTTASGTGGYLVSNIGDTNIRVNGCQLNENSTQSVTGTNGASVPHSVDPVHGYGVPAVQFGAVNSLFFENNETYDSGSVSFFATNTQNVRVVNNYLHQPTPLVARKNTDGVHFIGPDDQLYVQNNTINAGDDSIAYNADDDNTQTPSCCPSWQKNGPITNVHDDNNFLLNTYYGLRLYSGTSLIDNVEVSNLHGSACGNTGTFEANSSVGAGNLGTIRIDGWNIPTSGSCNIYSQPYNFIISENIANLQLSGIQDTNPGVNWPMLTQTAGTVGNLSLRNWDLNTQSSTFSNVIALNGGSIGQIAASGMNWYDASSNTGSFFSGSVVPVTLTCSNYAGPNRLLASGFVSTNPNGDCFANTYIAGIVYMNTTFNEAGSGNLAGTTPTTCAHGCTGSWSLPSGTDFTYQTGGGVATSTANAAFDVINAGATNGFLRFNQNTCSGSSNICQYVLRGTDASNKVIISITTGSSTCIYDEVSGSAALKGCAGSGPDGNYVVSFNGTQVSVTDPGSTTIGPFTVSNTGTQVGMGAAAAASMKVTSMSVKSQ